jgi:hypothetical protein
MAIQPLPTASVAPNGYLYADQSCEGTNDAVRRVKSLKGNPCLCSSAPGCAPVLPQ